MTEKRFNWRDLQKHVDHYKGDFSRENTAFQMLLAGYKVDLRQMPKIEGKRRPYEIRLKIMRMLRNHDGIAHDIDKDKMVIWAPEAYEERIKKEMLDRVFKTDHNSSGLS